MPFTLNHEMAYGGAGIPGLTLNIVREHAIKTLEEK